MIEGAVNGAYEAVVPLVLRDAAGEEREVQAVIDTGFNRFVTLPPTLVRELDCPFLGVTRVLLANGSEETLDLYGVTVLWNGERRELDALVADTTPLVGMSLLDGSSLFVDVQVGGRVVIDSVP